jgi:hypothetical protein
MGGAPLEVFAHDHQASILQIQRLQEPIGSVVLKLHINILPPLPAMSIARAESVVPGLGLASPNRCAARCRACVARLLARQASWY